MKQVKMRVLSEEGDLDFAIIEVPVSDPRPAYHPSQEPASKQKEVGRGSIPELE